MAAGLAWNPARLLPQSSARKRVLVVDENLSDLRGCVGALAEKGYEVSACSSFDEGKQCLEKKPFDLVIVSQGSVAFEGRALLERSIEIDRRVPVFAVTPTVVWRATLMQCNSA
jgi:DNA-binding NtrC family response regulator